MSTDPVAPAGAGPGESALRRLGPVLTALSHAFGAAGHELFLVGGSVRDALLDRVQHDLDFTTAARPDDVEEILTRFARTHHGGVWAIGKAFGTIGAQVRMADADGAVADWLIEVTTFRSDAYAVDSRKPAVEFGDTLEGDLGRRDFTVNAMAVRLPTGPDDEDWRFRDPYHGVSDLVARALRTPGTPEQSFSDDPLRMMRAARFAAQLDFTPAPEVVAAMTAMAERITIISAERVRDELAKTLMTSRPRIGLELLVATGIAGYVLPELPALQLERDEHHRHKDVFAHSLTVLDQAIDLEWERGHPPDLISRLAALLHDIGKPATRTFEPGGKVSFHHHDVVGAKLAKARLKALRFSSDEIASVSRLVELHLRFHGYGDGQWTDSAVRRYVRDAGPELERLHILTRADCTTRNQRKSARLRQAYDDLEVRIAELTAQEELQAMRPELDGNQIMAVLGLAPGREVGQAYAYLLEQRIERGPVSVETATAELLAWWAERIDQSQR